MNAFTISFAPLQGFTDAVYRRAHHTCAGGVDEYYTPFVRLEKGAPRRKDLRDTDPAANNSVPTVPQIIAADADELARLCDALQAQGWHRIDLNMGCPFPMQTNAGRGSGLLRNPAAVEAIVREMQRRPDVTFSVKMRLGQDSPDEGLAIIHLLNETPLLHVTIHPRIGRQQYKGQPDMESFARFKDLICHPVIYNGDITTLDQVADLRRQYPDIKGIMLGRGLLARPWLFCDTAQDPASHLEIVRNIHAIVYRHAVETLCGDSQILSRLHPFWEYYPVTADTRKPLKLIRKSPTIPKYNEAVSQLLGIPRNA